MIMPCFALMAFNVNDYVSMAETLSFEEFQSKFQEAYKNDDLSYITIEKDINSDTLEESLNLQENQTSVKFQNQVLNYQQVKTICNQNDYVVLEQEDSYKIRNKYSLKRIIVNGEIEDTYNASVHISGYKDYNILCYDTIEQTKYAYQQYTAQEDLNVLLDAVATTAEENVESEDYYDYSPYLSWGAEAMDLEIYKEYLYNDSITDEVVVAVLDTGINTAHEMLKDRILKDSNGSYVGYSYYNSKYKYSGYKFEDDKGHGSHVSGTIVDLTPSNVKILPIKVLSYDGSGAMSYSVWALEMVLDTYAPKYNVVATNMSLGADLLDSTSLTYFKQTFNDLFSQLKEKRILSAVSAGNDSKDTTTFSPAHCDDAIVVSALRKSGTSYAFDSYYSNFGESVDICAPGTSIKSAYATQSDKATPNIYATASGTSMASPHVAATIALLSIDKSYYDANGNPIYTAKDIEDRIIKSAIDMGTTGKDNYYGYGMLNLKNHSIAFKYNVTDCEVTYDGKYHNISVEVTNTDDWTIKYGLTKGVYDISDITTVDTFKNFTNGSIPVYFQISATGRYPTTGVGYLNIKQVGLTALLENQKFTYGDVRFDTTKYEVSGEIVKGENPSFSLKTDATNSSPVGDYDINLECSNNNYKLTYLPATLSITQREISITLQPQTFVYGDALNFNNKKYTITSGSVVNNDDLGLSITTTATNANNVGDYVITLSSYTNKNYKITCANSTLKVTERPVTISLNTQSVMYGDEIVVDTKDYVITSGSVLTGDDLGLNLSTDAQSKQVGSYTLKFNGASNKNYKVTASNGTFKVEARTIELVCNNQTFTYGEAFSFKTNDWTITKGSILAEDGDIVSLQTNATAESEAGVYGIYAFSNNTNYKLKVTPGKLTISPRVLGVSIAKQEILYGQTYDISTLQWERTTGTIVNNDVVEITFKTDKTITGAGEYKIIGVSSNKNYTIDIDNDTLIVAQRRVVIEIEQSGTYGNIVRCDSTKYKIIEGDILANDKLNLSFTTTATNRSNVGTYPITLANSNKNYEIVLQKAEYVINPRTLNVNCGYQEGVYGNTPTLNQGIYSISSGLISGDNPGIVLQTTATSKSGIGNYQINATTTNSNYKIVSRAGTYRVNRRPITIKLLDQKAGYSFSLKYNNNAYEIVSGSVVNNDDLLVTIYSDAKLHNLSGTFELYAYTDNQNYDIEVIAGTLEITFSGTSFFLIFAPITAITTIIVVGYLLRRRHNRNKYLKEDF